MKWRVSLFTVMLLFVLIGSAQAAPAAAQLTVSGPDHVNKGSEFAVQVNLANAQAVQAVEFNLQFDPAKVQVIAAGTKSYIQPSPLLEDALILYPNDGLANGNAVTMAAGWPTAGGINVDSSTSLGTVRFRALQEGQTEFSLSYTELVDKDSQQISHQIRNKTIVIDGSSPVLNITTPADGSTTNKNTITVAGTVDSGIASVQVNGRNVPVTSGAWTTQVVLTAQGANTITVTATNAAGKTTTKTITVYLDTVVTPFTVTSPEDNSVTSAGTISVDGTVETGAVVKVNGKTIQVNANGKFHDVFALEMGENTITVTATDAVGNTATIIRTVTRQSGGGGGGGGGGGNDTEVAPFTVDEPEEGLTTNASRINVRGTVEEGAVVTVNGKNAKVNNEKYQLNIYLAEGKNTITVAAKDRAGNTATITRTVTRGQVPGGELIVPGVGAAGSEAYQDLVGHWSEESVSELLYRGAMTGYPDGLFKPDKQITRVEVVAVLVRALQLGEGNPQGLKFKDNADIPVWARGYVAAAVQEDLIQGYRQADGTEIFAGGNTMTRAEMAIIMARILQKKLGPAQAAQLNFSDKQQIPAWAGEAIGICVNKGIITGYQDASFRPNAKISRGEAAVMIVRLLNLIEAQQA